MKEITSRASSKFLNYISDNIMVFDDRSQNRNSFQNDYISSLQRSNQTITSVSHWKQSPEGLDAAIMSQFLKPGVLKEMLQRKPSEHRIARPEQNENPLQVSKNRLSVNSV